MPPSAPPSDHLEDAFSEMVRTVPPDTILFSEGDQSHELLVLVRGRVEISKGGEPIAQLSARGTVLGEMSTLLKRPRTATARTVDTCRVIEIEPEAVAGFFRNAPGIGLRMARVLAQRLAHTTELAAAARRRARTFRHAYRDLLQRVEKASAGDPRLADLLAEHQQLTAYPTVELD